MSGSPGKDATASDGGAVDRDTRQQNYNFSGRVLLTAVVIVLVLTVVFVLIRILLYQLVVRPGSGRRRSFAAGILRSINSFGGISSRHGLDASALSALPVTSYRKGDGSTRGAAGADCAVCLSELEDGEKVRELLNCGHVFHVECVDAWLRSRTTCPLCRAEAEPKGKGKNKAEAEPKGKGKGKAEAEQSSSAPPALFGAGGTLVVTIQGRDARGSTSASGQPGAS